MNQKSIMKMVDHTLLEQTATWEQIQKICDQGIKYQTASICIPPSFVKAASQYVQGAVKICTVIGFPNGYATTQVKMQETADALQNGADEIDMVIHLGNVKMGDFDSVRREIEMLKNVCEDKILKVIIETCLLTTEEKIQMCRVVSESGADFIKTSTGFSKAGATFEDIELFKKYVSPHVKIKAAGGIGSFEDAEKFISLGANRLGTSRLVKILEGQSQG
jgi:deoxyribose-phosphate aldolase